MKKKYLVIVLGALATFGACKQKKTARAEETDREVENCYLSGKEVDCDFKKEFDEVKGLANSLKFYSPSENTFKEVVIYNDSIFELLKPLENTVKKTYELDESIANMYFGGIEKTRSKMEVLKRKIDVIDHLVLKATINNPNSKGEKFVDYTIENNSKEAFSMITMTTIYYDKNGGIVYTDNGDAIGNYDFKPAMKDDSFPAGYKGTAKRMPVLGPDEDLHPNIFSLKQEVTNITFK
ncbi:hypothetical protein [Aquimarina sediminis]|uniref:hypothetical protein n=1 Tax=Aquimarina sediminis TaxID=2070536 RepID=UPI000CA053BF|nr:hypothetical protein [Aquimarina sediminis]